MSCSARIGAFAAISLVLLRLATGWHFFQEGTNKLNDPNWSSAGFLLQAKGPLADFYHSKVPQAHNWQALLATPREAGFIDQERIAKHREWQEAYAEELEAAREAGEPEPFMISEYKPYAGWAEQIVGNWQATLERFFELPNLTEEEKEQASAALDEARLQLMSYLEEIEPEISEYQHELYRIEQFRKQGATGALAYHDERIQSKEAEANQMVQPWLAEVRAIEESYHDVLRHIYYTGQEARQAKAEQEAAERAAAAAATEEDASPDAPGQAEPNEAAADSVAPEAASGDAEAATDQDEPASQQEGLPPDPDSVNDPGSASDPGSANSTDAATTTSVVEVEVATPASPPQAAQDATGTGEGAPDMTPSAEASSPDEPSATEGGGTADGAGEPQQPVEDAEPAEGDPEAATAPEEEPLTLSDVLVDQKRAELELVDKIVTWSHVIIGACLVIGLFTPVAALAGAVFLAMVISTQPPWVPGTQDTYYQFVEMFSLLVLAATCAGRWAGLDYFFTLLFCRNERS